MVDNSTQCPVDVIFVLDESGSVSEHNFNLSKLFLSQLVARMDVNSSHTRVGLVCFSTNVTHEETFNLNKYLTTTSVQSAISSLTYTPGGSTHTAAALRYVREKMLTLAAGDRPDIPNVVFVMTDGQSNMNSHLTKVCTRAGKLRRKT